MKRLLVTAISVVWLGTIPGAAAALDILMTNDDGFQAVGIQTLAAALRGAGHDVTVVAPFGERSGSSAKIDLTPVNVVQVGAQDYALIALDEEVGTGDRVPIPATPASCVIFGLTVTLGGEAPDLVVSGTNVGANVGTATSFSGTVGGVTAALAADVPSIAFSSDPPDVPETDPAFVEHYENVAAFAVKLIARLEIKPGALKKESGLLPDGLGLNVNYPTLAPEDVEGVKLTVQGQASSASLEYVEIEPGIYIPAPGPGSGDEEDVKDSDTEALADGYITVTPITNDRTAGNSRFRLKSLIKKLH
ncbi:MAG: 5'/3'-nucleotidase SurE [Myxococcota bacterium]|nr:5'/3'-nucleotidase SurE [Myxococcota bacterium]